MAVYTLLYYCIYIYMCTRLCSTILQYSILYYTTRILLFLTISISTTLQPISASKSSRIYISISKCIDIVHLCSMWPKPNALVSSGGALRRAKLAKAEAAAPRTSQCTANQDSKVPQIMCICSHKFSHECIHIYICIYRCLIYLFIRLFVCCLVCLNF